MRQSVSEPPLLSLLQTCCYMQPHDSPRIRAVTQNRVFRDAAALGQKDLEPAPVHGQDDGLPAEDKRLTFLRWQAADAQKAQALAEAVQGEPGGTVPYALLQHS